MHPLRHRYAVALSRSFLVAGLMALSLLAPNMNGPVAVHSAAAAAPASPGGRGYERETARHYQPVLTNQPVAPSPQSAVPMRFSAAGEAAREQARLGKIVVTNGPPSAESGRKV